MKTRTSMTDIVRSHNFVYRCGCADLQHLFSGVDFCFYNCGIYGWNCDIFTGYTDGKSVAVTTGYRNMRGDRIPDYIVKAFESAAKSIYHESYSYDEKRENLEELRRVFFQLLANPDRMNQLEELYSRYNKIEITATQFYNAIVKGA